MSEAIGVVVVAMFLIGAAIWRVRDGRRMRDMPRDDTRRAGTDHETSPGDAAIRAEGTTAWARLSGP